MTQTIAIIAPGRMGAAMGGALIEAGYQVVTPLAARSAASKARAAAAGMQDIDEKDLAQVDLILSVVAPAEAESLASRVSRLLSGGYQAPVFVDLNAISPETATEIEEKIVGAGAKFADGCIIGTPPSAHYDGPYLYLSGPGAIQARDILARAPFPVRAIDGPTGAASAFKMSFAGVMKGLTSLAITMVLAADRAGAWPLMQSQLVESQPELWAWICRQIPPSHVKHGRWVAEMNEIANFLANTGDGEGEAQFRAHAAIFDRLARGSAERTRLREIFGE